MQATVHAVFLIAFAASTPLALLVLKRRAPTSRQFVIALAVAAVGTVVASPAFIRHMCREGQPLAPWLILGPCLFLILLFVNSAAWRRILGVVVFVGMVKLSCHFTDIVHMPGWTGNPDLDYGPVVLRSMRGQVTLAAGDSEDPQDTYAAGWLRDLPVWQDIVSEHGRDRRPRARRQVERAWHTWLTGLYHYTLVPRDYWYPGGPVAEAGPKLELRDRPVP